MFAVLLTVLRSSHVSPHGEPEAGMLGQRRGESSLGPTVAESSRRCAAAVLHGWRRRRRRLEPGGAARVVPRPAWLARRAGPLRRQLVQHRRHTLLPAAAGLLHQPRPGQARLGRPAELLAGHRTHFPAVAGQAVRELHLLGGIDRRLHRLSADRARRPAPPRVHQQTAASRGRQPNRAASRDRSELAEQKAAESAAAAVQPPQPARRVA